MDFYNENNEDKITEVTNVNENSKYFYRKICLFDTLNDIE
jgi:hypothetical protein